MLRTLALLVLSFVALPARAEAPEASLTGEIVYLGDPLDLVTTFQLIRQDTGDVLWSSRNVEATTRAGVVHLEALVPGGDWAPSKDVRWCLNVDARRARQPVQIQAVNLITPDRTYGNARTGRDFQGATGRACIRGASHPGLD